MQLRSGRSVIAPCNSSAPPAIPPVLPAVLPPVPVYKPTPSDMVSSYKPLTSSEHIVRYIFTLLDKYNTLTKDNDTKYMQLCANIPNDHVKENRIKNIETLWIIENVRIRTEMVSIMNENFDIISSVLPPFMLYGIVTDARYIHDKFNEYKTMFPTIASKYGSDYTVADIDRVINILLDEIDNFDDKFTEFIVSSYAQSRLYTF